MTKLLLVGLGGFFGAVLRYAATAWVHARHGGAFPLGTLAVNVAGCFLAGLLWAFLEARPGVGAEARLLLGIGFLGGLTTFSAFGVETVELLRAGESRLALLGVAANVLLGLGAVAGGRAVLRGLLQ